MFISSQTLRSSSRSNNPCSFNNINQKYACRLEPTISLINHESGVNLVYFHFIKMDDPESKWEIQVYSSSKADETSVVQWIFTSGYVIGREIVITGITISSAQLVLPPLVVFSAMGVSFGVLYASYVCTNKIMSFLLPIPWSPPMLEDYADEVEQGNDERVDCKLGLDDDVVETNEDDYGGPEVEGYVTDEEDNEQMEDVNKGVETEIVLELDDDHRQEGRSLIANVEEDVDEMEMEDNIIQGGNATEEKEREPMEDVKKPSFDDVGDDEGYIEEDDDSLEDERKGKKPLVKSQNDEDAKLRDEGRLDNTVEDGHFVSGSASNVVFGDVKDVESASSEAFGDVKDVDSVSCAAFEDVKDVESASSAAFGDVKDVESASSAAFGDVKDVKSASNVAFGDVMDVETTKPVTVEEIDSHKSVVRNKNDEHACEMRHTMVLSDENNLNSSEVYALDLAAREVIGDADKNERTIKFDEKVVAESSASKDGSEDDILRTIEEHLIHSNAEVREISNENLLDERSTNNNLESLKGYEEDIGEYLVGDNHGLEEEQKGKEPLVENWNYENESKTQEVNEDAKLRHKGRVDDTIEEDCIVSESASNVVFGDVKDVETTNQVTVKEIDSQKLVEVGNKNEERVCEMRHTVVLSDENNLNSREIYTSDLAVREVIGDANKAERTIKFDETVVTESSASKDGSEYVILRTIEEHLIHSIEDARENGDESLLGERNTNNNLEIPEVGNEVKEDVAEVLARAPLKHDTDDVGVAHKKMASREENLDYEKIWEKIGAMRTIVGYKAPSQPTCIGELKALYVFTGVEPPASFEGDSDLDAKLKFLMAIVGVK